MAETVKLPGLGNVKTLYVVGGFAAVAGIVGYAYFTRGSSSSESDLGTSPDDYGVSDYDSPLGNSGGNSTVTVPGDDSIISTNAQWTLKAVSYLSDAGFEAGMSAVALGKYLARLALNKTEIDAVLAARAGIGEPPVGGPYPVKEALPDPPASNPPPTNNPPANNPPAQKNYKAQLVRGPGHGWESTFASIAGHYGKSQSYLWNLDRNQHLRKKYNHYSKITKGDTVYIDY